jgi:hypothetical protein
MKHVAVAAAILLTQMAHGQVQSFLESFGQATTTDATNDNAFYLWEGDAIKTFRSSIVGTSDCLNLWSTLLVMAKEKHTYVGRSRKDVIKPSSVESLTDYEALSIALRLDQASVNVTDMFIVNGDTIKLCLKMKKDGNSVVVLD